MILGRCHFRTLVSRGVAFATEFYLQGKLNKGISNFYEKTQEIAVKRAHQFEIKLLAQNNLKPALAKVSHANQPAQTLTPQEHVSHISNKNSLIETVPPKQLPRLGHYFDPEGLPLKAHIIEAIENGRAYFQKKIAQYEQKIVKRIQELLKQQGIEYTQPITIKDIDFKHTIVGDWNPRRKQPTGLHSTRWCSEKIKENTRDTSNIFKAQWQANGVSKKSTFFPASWDENKIADAAIEALQNIIEVAVNDDGLKICGQTLEKIKIKFYIDNFGTIKTFYPKLD